MLDSLLLSNRSAVRRRSALALGVILALYGIGRFLEILPFSTPSTPYVALEVLSAFAFALFDGAQHYGFRGILVFTAICLLIGNFVENFGVATGFPFGPFQFLDLMGPKFLNVPLLLGLAYVGMAYVCWTLARLILGATRSTLTGSDLIAVPLLASFIMTAWDLAQDPVWSTLLHAWRWRRGGAWFGVPVSNFGGWLLTVFLINITFATYLRRTLPAAPAKPILWRFAVLFYVLCAIGNVLQLLRPEHADLIADPSGTLWHVAAILRVSALVSIFVMGPFALLAWLRIPAGCDATD